MNSRDDSGNRKLDELADEFERSMRSGERPMIEQYLQRIEDGLRESLLEILLALELEWNQSRGLTLIPDRYPRRFPQYHQVVQKVLDEFTERSSGQSSPRSGDPARPVPERTEVLPRRQGKFLLQRKLGSGGFGTVYLAEDMELHRHVALKIPHRIDDPALRRRFVTEAKAAASLDHPGIVRVYESELVSDNLYIATAYIDGKDLVETLKSKGAGLKTQVAWIRDAARALAYAHQRGVIHRDVKPGNMLIDQQGRLYVSDFGLARRVEDNSSLTSTGDILGTPRYMAPEQAAGLNASVGPASDQYSLAVILFEVLTGRPPFRSKLPKLLEDICREAPPKPSELHPKVPPELEAICLKGLAKNPAHRYEDAHAFADDLDRWLNGQAVTTTLQQPGGVRALLRNRTVTMFATAMLVLLLLGGGVLALSGVLSTGGHPADLAGMEDRQKPDNDLDKLRNDDDQDVSPLPGNPREVEPAWQLAGQREQLVSALAVGTSWSLNVLDVAGAEIPGSLTVLDQGNDGQGIQLLLSATDQAVGRSLWQGRLEERRFPAAHGSAWVAVLLPQKGNLRPAGHAPELVLSINPQHQLVRVREPQPVPLNPLPALVLPPPADLAAAVNQATQRGQVWEGTLQYPEQASQRIRLTFTAHEDQGRHVSAIVESVDNPFAMTTFLGVVLSDPAELLAGRPIQLKRHQDLLQTYGPPYLQPTLDLSYGDVLLTGTLGQGAVSLKRQPGVQLEDTRAAPWKANLVPGTVWEGTLKFGIEPPLKVRFTVAEVRDDYSYVRLLAENMENSFMYAIYEGALDQSSEQIDGFALKMMARLVPIQTSPGNVPNRLFGFAENREHWVRVSLDGSRLFVYSAGQELITLTPLKERIASDLTRAGRSRHWREVFQLGKTWEGTLHNSTVNLSTRVTLTVTKSPDEFGKLEATVFETNRNRAIRIPLSGTLEPDADLKANGFALRLEKTRQGTGGSILLGASRTTTLTQIRLTTDGQGLVGVVADSPAADPSHQWEEFMQLRLVKDE